MAQDDLAMVQTARRRERDRIRAELNRARGLVPYRLVERVEHGEPAALTASARSEIVWAEPPDLSHHEALVASIHRTQLRQFAAEVATSAEAAAETANRADLMRRQEEARKAGYAERRLAQLQAEDEARQVLVNTTNN